MRVLCFLMACCCVGLGSVVAQSALHQAAERGDRAEVRRLLAAGAEVDAKDPYKATALMFAARCGYADVATVLLEAGAEVDLQDYRGYTALIWAVASWEFGDDARLALVGVFLEAGADTALSTTAGHTALQLAERRGHEAVARVLRTVLLAAPVPTSAATPEFLVHPNPARGVLYVRTASGGALSLYDTTGRLLGIHKIAAGVSSVSLSSYPAGVYALRAVSNAPAHPIRLLRLVKE